MKKFISFFGIVLLALLMFSSCSEKNEVQVAQEYALNPVSLTIKGGLSDFFEIVEGNYKLTPDEKYSGSGFPNHYQVKVQFIRNNVPFNFEIIPIPNIVGGFNLYCDLLAEDKSPVIMADRGGLISQGSSEGVVALSSLKEGESGWVIFHFSGKQELLNKIKMFSIDSESGEQIQISSNSNKETDNSKMDVGNFDCDKFIEDYSSFVNSYIKLVQKYKANPTDPNIITEYAEAADKLTEIQSDISNCTDPKHANKLLELVNKLAKEAL
jgi:hypothetical protein